MAKPSTRLNTDKLKSYRELAGLSQGAVACRLYGDPQLHDPNDGSEYQRRLHSLRNTYQRIERRGRTTPRTARELAKILGTTVSDLTDQNDTAPRVPFGPMLERLEDALVKWRDNPTHPLLDEVLPDPIPDGIWTALYEALNDFRHGEEDLRSTVETLSKLLEPAFLAPRPNPVDTLLKKLGLASDTFNGYFYAEGLWLITTQGWGFKDFGTLIQGRPRLIQKLEELLKDAQYLPDYAFDSTANPADTITCTQSETFYRVEVIHPLSQTHWWIDITRVEKAVAGNGLTYVQSPGLDQTILMMEVDHLCRRAAWYTRGFYDSHDQVASDVDCRLRLEMSCYVVSTGEEICYALHENGIARSCADLWDQNHAITRHRREFIVLNLTHRALEAIDKRLGKEIADLEYSYTDLSGVTFFTKGVSCRCRVGLVADRDGVTDNVVWPEASLSRFMRDLQDRLVGTNDEPDEH